MPWQVVVGEHHAARHRRVEPQDSGPEDLQPLALAQCLREIAPAKHHHVKAGRAPERRLVPVGAAVSAPYGREPGSETGDEHLGQGRDDVELDGVVREPVQLGELA